MSPAQGGESVSGRLSQLRELNPLESGARPPALPRVLDARPRGKNKQSKSAQGQRPLYDQADLIAPSSTSSCTRKKHQRRDEADGSRCLSVDARTRSHRLLDAPPPLPLLPPVRPAFSAVRHARHSFRQRDTSSSTQGFTGEEKRPGPEERARPGGRPSRSKVDCP